MSWIGAWLIIFQGSRYELYAINMRAAARNRLLSLLLVSGAGFVLCKLLFQLPNKPQSNRWQLFGDAFMSERELHAPGIPRHPVKREEQIIHLAGSLADSKETRELVQALGALQVSCYNHPESEGLLKKYGRFLEVLALYSSFHRRERRSESVKKLIWVCDVYEACGGLADRMKGISYALILAILSQRVLLLNWRDSEFGEHSFLEANAIDWQLNYVDWNLLGKYDRIAEVRDYGYGDNDGDGELAFVHLFGILDGYGVDVSKDTLRASFKTVTGDVKWVVLASNLEPSALLNSTKTASSEWISQGVASLGLSHLPLGDVDRLVGLVFRYLFKFSDELMREVRAARGVLGLDGQQYLGVHVRTGFAGSPQQETVEHPKLIRRIWQWEKTLFCAYRFASELLGTSGLIFLATDSTLVKNRTLQTYRGKFRTLENTILHLDKLEKYPHVPMEAEIEGVLATWIDFVLLAESFALVREDSGFSALAGDVCFIPRQQIISGLHCAKQG